MNRKLPDRLQTAGILQIASGALNIFFMAGVSYFLLAVGFGFITAIMTCGFLPVGVFCGFGGFLLIPVGILEIVTGVLLLTDNESATNLSGITSKVQKASILCGGLGSIIISFIVDGILREPEVAYFLENRDA
jgi:hypothetical protein